MFNKKKDLTKPALAIYSIYHDLLILNTSNSLLFVISKLQKNTGLIILHLVALPKCKAMPTTIFSNGAWSPICAAPYIILTRNIFGLDVNALDPQHIVIQEEFAVYHNHMYFDEILAFSIFLVCYMADT